MRRTTLRPTPPMRRPFGPDQELLRRTSRLVSAVQPMVQAKQQSSTAWRIWPCRGVFVLDPAAPGGLPEGVTASDVGPRQGAGIASTIGPGERCICNPRSHCQVVIPALASLGDMHTDRNMRSNNARALYHVQYAARRP